MRPAAALLLLLGLQVGPSVAQPASLLWPLELQPALSSTFGETRATAFHAGIDLKTWGKTGYAVRAVADGWIQRVRTSPWGYGRALYQRLADGRIAVYAHLEGFFEPVQDRVRLKQRASRRYSVQLWLEEGEIPVRRGQIIARTGQSGAGAPHLHLEIRDADNIPLNPLQQGLGPVPDTTPPTLRRLLVVPLSASTRIDGGYEAVAIPVHPSKDGEGFVAGRSVRVWGRVGFAVDSHDRADLAPNKVAVWRQGLRVDGETILTSTYERISWDDGHLVALDRLRPSSAKGSFSALFRRPGNRLSFYTTDRPETDGSLLAGGREGLPSGTHEVVVWAQDVTGNETEVRLRLDVTAPPKIIDARLTKAHGDWFLEADVTDRDDERLAVVIGAVGKVGTVVEGTIAVGAGPFTWALPAGADVAAWSLTVRDAVGNRQTRTLAVPRPVPDPEPFQLEISAIPRSRHVLLRVQSPRPLHQGPRIVGEPELHLQEESPGVFSGVFPLDESMADSAVVEISAVATDGGMGRGRLVLSAMAARPGQAQDIPLLGGDVVLHLAAGSAFEVLYPQATRLTSDALTVDPASGLRPTGLGCEIGPADAAFDEWARISMRTPAGEAQRLGLYVDGGKGKWVFLGADEDGDTGTLSTRIRAFGRFALMQDLLPPTIDNLQPESGIVVDGDVTFSADVADAGSGIKREEDVVLELDGLRLISEYDPEAERVWAVADQPLAPGVHHLVLTLRDAAGNQSQSRSDFISR